jgi:hypothetical protein
MISLPSLLKEAIIEQDWDKASSAYELLTGEVISDVATVEPQPPQEETKEPPTSDHIASSHKEGGQYEGIKAEGAARREPMSLSERKNAWVDDGSIAADEMVSKNPSLGVSNPVARNRPISQKNTARNTGDIRVDQSPKLEK